MSVTPSIPGIFDFVKLTYMLFSSLMVRRVPTKDPDTRETVGT